MLRGLLQLMELYKKTHRWNFVVNGVFYSDITVITVAVTEYCYMFLRFASSLSSSAVSSFGR